MQISGLQKLTLTDYPETLACIVFTQGCNFKCPFCQNSTLINNQEGLLDEEEVLDYINLRKGILEGVVISGGEPTIQKNLKNFIKKIKKLNLKVKLDTNGSNYELLKDLIDSNLVDYVAMDVKDDFDSYNIIAGCQVKIDNIKKSIDLLKQNKVDYEFRTTIVKEFHDINKILKLCHYFKGCNYYLQNFQNSEHVLDKKLSSFTDLELDEIKEKLEFSNTKIRGK